MFAITAGLIFAFMPTAKTKQVLEVRALNEKVQLGSSKEEFSALFGGDIIFSAEKVYVSATETDGFPNEITSGANKFAMPGDKNISFQNIPNGYSSKTVVEDGSFVKLNNKVEGSTIYSPVAANNQEAILVSFGSYVYRGEESPVNIQSGGTNKITSM